jgi:hypothetical protein
MMTLMVDDKGEDELQWQLWSIRKWRKVSDNDNDNENDNDNNEHWESEGGSMRNWMTVDNIR